MSELRQWFKDHLTAILTTSIVVAKSGALGKMGIAVVTALSIALGVQ